MNIYQKLNEVREAVEYIKKEKEVMGYKAVTHDQVTSIVRPEFIKQGIVTVPRLITERTVETGKNTGRGTPIMRHEVVYEFDFINADIPSEVVTVRLSAHADDTDDKAPGKALSYAKKYAVLKVLDIETGEDDESRIHSVGAVSQFADKMKAALVDGDKFAVGQMAWEFPDLYEQANNKTPKNGGYFTSKDKELIGNLNTEYRKAIAEIAQQINEAVEKDDELAVSEILEEMTHRADKTLLWAQVSDASKVFIKDLQEKLAA